MTSQPGWASTRSPAPALVAVWSPRLASTLVHQALRLIVEADRHACTATAAAEAMEAVMPGGLATTHRLMLSQRGIARLLIWSRRFDPRPNWTLRATDLQATSAAVDLLWTRAGEIRADHIISGPLGTASRREARRVADVHAAAFGAAFTGVRLISLTPAPPKQEIVPAVPGAGIPVSTPQPRLRRGPATPQPRAGS